jgi:hypothetical protein
MCIPVGGACGPHGRWAGPFSREVPVVDDRSILAEVGDLYPCAPSHSEEIFGLYAPLGNSHFRAITKRET